MKPEDMEKEVSNLIRLIGLQIIKKANMYDGFNNIGTSGLDSISRFMFSVIEEAGEVSSALARHRYELAKAECIDVAHSAILLYKAIELRQKEVE